MLIASLMLTQNSSRLVLSFHVESYSRLHSVLPFTSSLDPMRLSHISAHPRTASLVQRGCSPVTRLASGFPAQQQPSQDGRVLARLRNSGLLHAAGASFASSYSTSSSGRQTSTACSKSAAEPQPLAEAVTDQETSQDGTGAQDQQEGQQRMYATNDTDVHIGHAAQGLQGRPLVLVSGAFVLPHPDKMAKGGEDWYFIAANQRAVGVADGVGGWAEVKVDAGAYARGIMNHALEMADQQAQTPTQAAAGSNGSGPEHKQQKLSAQDILEGAYNETKVKGSSTACVMVLNGDLLTGSNLGDSGFMIIRDGEMLMGTTPQQHSFNFPFQIGGPDAMSDHPRVAHRYEIQVQSGDIIVAGTDGLWDNCFHEEILSVMKYCREGNMSPERSSQVLAHYARHRATDTKFASPFSYAAYQAGIRYMGGKLDDITILVAFVQPAGAAPVASKL